MNAKDLLNKLKLTGYNLFIEVPCSSLAPLISAAMEDKEVDVINPANEAIAIGIASGAYLTGKKPALLIQNSGFLNTLNSLTSLNLIYDIPVLYIISWRGFSKDAPEHEIVGKDMEKYLKAFGIPYSILEEENIDKSLHDGNEYIINLKKPYALLVKPGLFDNNRSENTNSNYEMERKEAIKIVKDVLLKNGYKIISTNGFISRESFDINGSDDFYMLGSMGHALPIGIGLAKYSNKKIAVFDGDGAVLMHLGSMLNVSLVGQKNFVHVVFDNEAYASTGNQPALSKDFDIFEMGKISGYKVAHKAIDRKTLDKSLREIVKTEGPSFLLIKVKAGNANNCKRIRMCVEIKERFIRAIND